MIQIGDIVAATNFSRLAVVRRLWECGGRKLASLHWIDSETGNLLVCPDFARCQHNDTTCPIHGVSVDLDQVAVMSVRDLEFYENEGALAVCLAYAAKQNHVTRANAEAAKLKEREDFQKQIEYLTNPEPERIIDVNTLPLPIEFSDGTGGCGPVTAAERHPRWIDKKIADGSGLEGGIFSTGGTVGTKSVVEFAPAGDSGRKLREVCVEILDWLNSGTSLHPDSALHEELREAMKELS